MHVGSRGVRGASCCSAARGQPPADGAGGIREGKAQPGGWGEGGRGGADPHGAAGEGPNAFQLGRRLEHHWHAPMKTLRLCQHAGVMLAGSSNAPHMCIQSVRRVCSLVLHMPSKVTPARKVAEVAHLKVALDASAAERNRLAAALASAEAARGAATQVRHIWSGSDTQHPPF